MSRNLIAGLLIFLLFWTDFASGSGTGICKVIGEVKSVRKLKPALNSNLGNDLQVELKPESIVISEVSGDGLCELVKRSDFQVLRVGALPWKVDTIVVQILECTHGMGANGILHSCRRVSLK